MKMIKHTAVLILGLVAYLVVTPAVAAEQELDPSWKKAKTTIDSVDLKHRSIVVADREFDVPFNTYIYGPDQAAIALSNLKSGNKIWLYLDKSRSQIKRIDKIQK
jgi:uncharacterized protein YchJ